jgi:single-stranded-DNA-specific exonuclease
VQFGGHKAAACLEIKIENLEEFKNRFNITLKKNLKDDEIIPEIKIDAKISLCEITPKFVRVLEQFAPFGPGNMRPIFLAENVKLIAQPRIVGTNHFVTTFCQNGGDKVYDAIGFNLGKFVYEIDKEKDLVDIVFTIEKIVKEGRTYPQIRVKDLRVKEKSKI